jgi:hypothetical protein
VAKYAGWVAVLICMLLLTSVLDNIPDCPELLNQRQATAMSIHSGDHLGSPAVPLSPFTKHIALVQLSITNQLIADVAFPTPLSCIVGSLCQAANTSPPLV